MFKSTIQVTLFSVFGIVINFIIQLLLAYFFGATEERDAFFAAGSVPNYINAIIAGSLVVVFLPRLIDIRIAGDRKPANLISSMMTFMIILLLLVTLPILFFSEQIVSLLFQGFDTAKISLTARLLLVLSPSLLFQALCNVLIAIYHSGNQFLKPSGSLLVTPVCTILVTCLLQKQIGILSVAMGTSIGWLVTFVYLQFHLGIKYRFSVPLLLNDKDLHYCLNKSTPLFLGSFIYRGNTVIEKMAASNFPAGVISYVGYASSMVTMLSAVTINGIATTMFPQLSEAWSARDMEKFRKFYSNSLKVILILCVPIISVTVVFSKTIVATFLQRGAFSDHDTQEVSKLLTVLMSSYFFVCLNTIPGKMFYVTGITKIGLVNAILEVVIYAVLCILLGKAFSYYGIAYAQVISVACSTILASIILQVKFQVIKVRAVMPDVLKIILCGLLSYALMNTFYLWFPGQSFLIMVLFGGTATLIYFFVLSLILEDAGRVRQMIQRKIQNLTPSK